MLDLAGEHQARTQSEMTLQHVQCPRAELDQAVLTGLRPIFVPRHDARFGDTDLPLADVAVRDEQRDLLGWTQAGEEAKFVIVALRRAPVAVQRGDERFRLLDRERVDDGPVLLYDAKALQTGGGIVLLRMIAVAVVECAPQWTDDVVMGLLRKLPRVSDFDQVGILDPVEEHGPDRWSPDAVQNLAIALVGREGEIALRHPRLAVGHELIEYVVAGACAARVAAQLLHVTVFRKFFREYECAAGDAAFDLLELNTGTS